MSKPDPALAAVLKRFRKRERLSQEGLAFNAGVIVATLSRIERGVSDPRWTDVRAIARALDVSMDELGSAVEMEQP